MSHCHETELLGSGNSFDDRKPTVSWLELQYSLSGLVPGC